MKNVDIKQLLLFCTLIECQSLTETARRMQVTPSAVSQTLARLREIMNDPLYIRQGSQYIPTPFAKGVLARFREIVDMWEDVAEPQGFDAARSDAHLVVACADTFGQAALAELYRRVTQAAPHMALDIQAPENGPQDLADLREGRTDLVCGTVDPPPDARDIIVETVRHFHLTHCCLNRNHPRLGLTLSLSQYLSEEHIAVAPPRRSRTYIDPVDMELQRLEFAPRIKTVVNSWPLCAELLARTDRLATVSYEQAEMLMRCSPAIKAVPLPLSFAWPCQPVNIAWHERTHGSKPHRWLRAQFRELLRGGHESPADLAAVPPAPPRVVRPAISLVARTMEA